MKAYVDPKTGEFTTPPPAQPSAAPQPSAASAGSALATSHEGLVPMRGTTRGGGWIVDLKGRFRSAVVATVEPDGSMATRCVTVPVSGTAVAQQPAAKPDPSCPEEAPRAH